MLTKKRQDSKKRLAELVAQLPSDLGLEVALRNSAYSAFSPQKGHWLVLSKADDRQILGTPWREEAQCAVLEELLQDQVRLQALRALTFATPRLEIEAWLCDARSGSPLRLLDGWIPQHRRRTFPPSQQRFWARHELLELRSQASEATIRLHLGGAETEALTGSEGEQLEILEGHRLVAVAKITRKIPAAATEPS